LYNLRVGLRYVQDFLMFPEGAFMRSYCHKCMDVFAWRHYAITT
jgi:hypothetical protein